MREIKRIVVLGHDKKIGDIFIWLTVLEALEAVSPDTRVIWISQPGVKEVVEGHPMVEEFWDYPQKSIISRLRLKRKIRDAKPEAVLLLQNNIAKRWSRIFSWAKVPIRVGCLDTKKRGRRLTHNIFEPGLEWHEKPSARKALDMLGLALDVEVPDFPCKMVLSAETSAKISVANAALNLPEKFFVLHLGTGGSNRTVSPDFFARVATRLYDAHGLVPALSGSSAEKELEREFLAAYTGPYVSMIGRTGIAQLAEVCRQSKFVLSVDTGTVHAAAAVGVPSVVLMPRLSVAPRRWAPWFVPSIIVRPSEFCSACSVWKCQTGQDICITHLSEQDTFEACEGIFLERESPRVGDPGGHSGECYRLMSGASSAPA
jgi:ADP-heptose:LPS heptosyltransferase